MIDIKPGEVYILPITITYPHPFLEIYLSTSFIELKELIEERVQYAGG